MRDETVMMARIRNERRWIRRCMQRTWLVAKTCVIWDDGSTDNTRLEIIASLGPQRDLEHWPSDAGPEVWRRRDGSELHYIRSPYRDNDPRPGLEKFQVNEIRDKNGLWEYTKSRVGAPYILCLDGDEMLSLALVRSFHEVWHSLRAYDLVNLPFIYLWDSEAERRIDGIYGDLQPNLARLNFPRVFTTARWSGQEVFDSHFAWEGTKGGFHCGSIPRAQAKASLNSGVVHAPVVHFGYIDDDLRHRKFAFYNAIDPGNEFEGEYKHIIGVPNIHAPGRVELVPWEDK